MRNVLTRRGTVNADQGGAATLGAKPSAGCKSLERSSAYPPNLGAGNEKTAGVCVELSSPDPRHGHGQPASAATSANPTRQAPALARAEEVATSAAVASQRLPLCTVEEDQPGHILYAGQRLPAVFVSEINTRRVEGTDTLVRDEVGRYYLHRRVYTDAQGRCLPASDFGPTSRAYSRHLLHRLSHAAMALWMIETSGGKRQVRKDAASFWQHQLSSADGVTVTLDAHSTSLARKCLRYNEHAPVHHLGDLVNAAVAFFEDDTDQGVSTRDHVEQARARRLARGPVRDNTGKTAVTLHLSAAQLRMFQQIADYQPEESLSDVVSRELGQHVALHLECYHGHQLEAARQGWQRTGEPLEVAA